MNQLQVDLADMKAFGGKPYPFMLVAIDALTKKVAAEGPSCGTTAAGMKKVFQALGAPANVGRRGQWHLMLADILSQINGRKHEVTRPEIKVGDIVRIRVKPIESRGSSGSTR